MPKPSQPVPAEDTFDPGEPESRSKIIKRISIGEFGLVDPLDRGMVRPAQSGYVISGDRPSLTSMQEDAANTGIVSVATIV